MKKFSKIGKRVLAFFLVALMNINTYAAVGANDGTAFVTKAEFDDMMYDFNIKMNEYQSAINAKIDASISSYLAGMSAQSVLDLENYAKMVKEYDPNNAKFTQWKTPEVSKNVHDINGTFAIYRASGINGDNNAESTAINNKMYAGTGINNAIAWAGKAVSVRYTNYTGNTANFTSAYYFASFPYKANGNTSDWTLQQIKRKRFHLDISAIKISFSSSWSGLTWQEANVNLKDSFTIDTTRLTMPGNFTHPTMDSRGYGIMASGDLTPQCIQTHAWSDFNASTDNTNNAFLNYNLSGTIAGSDSAVDYEMRDYYDTSSPITLDIQKDRASSTSHDGNLSGSWLGGRTAGVPLKDKKGVTEEAFNNATFYFKYNRPTIYNLNWTRLTNEYYNTLLAKPVYKYNGMPITKTNREGTIKFTLTLNNPSTGTYVYAISDKPFENGAIPEHMYETVGGKQYDHILLRGAVSRSGDEVIDVSLDKAKVYDTIKGDVLWLKVEPSVAGEIVSATVSNNIREYLNN